MNDNNTVDVARCTSRLVEAAEKVLGQFRSGYRPSEWQLNSLDAALFPFLTERICGHTIIEDCDCGEEK
jgi:hypothetical protein